jgi:trans-aconitate methyltransferase
MFSIFGTSTDKAWKALGRDDPYFGVLAQREFSRENLSAASLEKFFQSGEAATAELLSVVERIAIPPPRLGRALDFGCGVGRMIIPLASRFKEVIGVDVSEHMLAEAARNVSHRQLANVTLFADIPNMEFDLVHSVLVFQHINPRRGADIILKCWSRVAQGGVLAVQVPIRFVGHRTVWWLRKLRDILPILQVPYNVLSGNRWNKPGVQMNLYDVNSFAANLLERGAKQIVLTRQDSDALFSGIYVLAIKE